MGAASTRRPQSGERTNRSAHGTGVSPAFGPSCRHGPINVALTQRYLYHCAVPQRFFSPVIERGNRGLDWTGRPQCRGCSAPCPYMRSACRAFVPGTLECSFDPEHSAGSIVNRDVFIRAYSEHHHEHDHVLLSYSRDHHHLYLTLTLFFDSDYFPRLDTVLLCLARNSRG